MFLMKGKEGGDMGNHEAKLLKLLFTFNTFDQ